MYLDHIQPEVFGPVPLFPQLKNNPFCPVSAVCMPTGVRLPTRAQAMYQ